MMKNYNKKMKFIFVSLFLTTLFSLKICDEKVVANSCFVPPLNKQKNCLDLFLNEINKSINSIYIECYSFTSQDIVNAIRNASHKGVKINILSDKSNTVSKYGKKALNQLLNNENIKIKIDCISSIAHNKIAIFDNVTLSTGSINFSENGFKKNLENMIFIRNSVLVIGDYLNYFSKRWYKSRDFYLDMTCKNK